MNNPAENSASPARNDDLDMVPVAGRIGVEIRGIRLSEDLDDQTIASIRSAILKHKVVFFRDQQHLDDASHEAFSARLGPLLKHPVAKAADSSEAILKLATSEAYAASIWHTDLTFTPHVAAFGILRPEALPSYGGDTLWANTAEAYRRMPEPLRILADSLWGLHSTQFDFAGHFSEEYKERLGAYAKGQQAAANPIVTKQPVVHVHHETGERALLLGSWLQLFVGLTSAQSQKIFELFQEQIEAAENTVRWHWRMGDVAIWDNRATQHRSVPDFGDEQRVLRRVTVAGTSVPVSIDGTLAHLVDQ